MADRQFRKRAAVAFVAGVNFATWPLQPGETLVATNARGSLAVRIEDASGSNQSDSMTEGTPAIDGSKVRFWLKAGTAGQEYKVIVTAPTSDGELLEAAIPLFVEAA